MSFLRKKRTSPPAENDNLSGAELRDRSWKLIGDAQLDFMPRFLRVCDESPPHPADGLIRAGTGYYRLAEDKRNGTRILLHSNEREQLEGVLQDGEVHILVHETADYDIYGITARPGTDAHGRRFRADMESDIYFLDEIYRADLNLHASEVVLDEKEGYWPRILKMANGRMGFSISEVFNENDLHFYAPHKKRWQVRAFTNLRQNWGMASGFTNFGNEQSSGILNKFINNGKNLKEFENYEDALHYVRRYWKVASMRLFKGKPMLGEEKSILTKARKWVAEQFLKIRDQHAYRAWTAAALIAAASALGEVYFKKGEEVAKTITAVGLTTAAATSTVIATLEKFAEDWIDKTWEQRAERKDIEKAEAKLPGELRNHIEHYLKPGEANHKRARRKIDPSIIPHLRLLNADEADMGYDNAAFTPVTDETVCYERIMAAPQSNFGAVFDVTHYKRGIFAAAYPNGIVSLTCVDGASRRARVYVAYSEKFNLMSKKKLKHMDPALLGISQSSPYHKVAHGHDRNGKFIEREFNAQSLKKEFSFRLGPGYEATSFFGVPLRDFFKMTAEGEVPMQNSVSNMAEELSAEHATELVAA